jgi:hypothetical protein
MKKGNGGPENREGQVLTCPDACMCSAENQPASEPAEISLPYVSNDGENSRLVNVRLLVEISLPTPVRERRRISPSPADEGVRSGNHPLHPSMTAVYPMKKQKSNKCLFRLSFSMIYVFGFHYPRLLKRNEREPLC